MKLQKYDFTPHQPYLERNTVYYSYKPDATDPLYGIVWEVYQVDNYDFNKSMAFPDICADIMVFYTNTNAYCYFMSGTANLRSMASDISFMKDTHSIFGVKFFSGSLGNIFNVPVCDAGENILEVKDILTPGSEMISQLSEAHTFIHRWNAVKKYLLNKMHTDYKTDVLTNYAAKRIVTNHGSIKIQDLEAETGYSNRYLRKKFTEHLGISMKTFCQITQLHWSYDLYHQLNGQICLSELALMSGYYDQSHMNNNYKKLTGLLPSAAVRLYITHEYMNI